MLEIDRELESIRSELSQLHEATVATPKFKALVRAKNQARANLEKEVRSLPGMLAIEAEMDRIRARAESLRRARNMIIEKHATRVQAKRLELEESEKALEASLLGGDRGRTLVARHELLLRRKAQLRKASRIASTK